MPLKNIQETIKKQAQEKIAEIKKEAQKQVQKIEAEINNEKENIIKEIQEKTNSKIKSLKEQNKIFLEIQRRNSVLAKKLELIKEAQDNAIEGLRKLKSSEYEGIIKKLLEKISLNGSEVEIIIPESKKFESKNALKAANKNFTAKADKNLKGGFIIKTDKFEINNSFADIVSQIFEEKEMEIVELLFD
ncbi:MAG: V-type ATP synthase subunit E family protein [bacterium]